MEFLGILWNELLMRPMINSLALLADVLFSNFGLSIIVFTVFIRIVLIPLTIRQTRSMKKMQELQFYEMDQQNYEITEDSRTLGSEDFDRCA